MPSALHALERIHHTLLHIESALHKSGAGPITCQDLNQLKETLMASQAEQAAILRTLAGQLTTVRTEIQGVQTAVNDAKAEIVKLEAVIAAGGGEGVATQELIDAVAAVKEAVQFADDEIPNLPPTPPTV